MAIQQVAVLALILGGVAVAIIITISIRGHRWLSDQGDFWMPRLERMRFLSSMRRKGVCLDGTRKKMSELNAFRHFLIVGNSGSGKSTVFCLGNLLQATGKDSIFVFDASGELKKLSGGYLASIGMQIMVVNVSNIEESLTWNPLTRCRSKSDLHVLATTLVGASSKGLTDSFWSQSACELLTTILSALMSSPKSKYHTLANARRLLSYVGDDELDKFILSVSDESTWVDWMSFRKNSEKVAMSILATCRTALLPFQNPALVQLTSSNTLDLSALRRTPTCLFIQIPEYQASEWGFFTALLYQELFSLLMEREVPGKPYLKIFGLLDEFGNTARINNFTEYLTALRKRNVSLSLLVQGVSQIESKYTKASADTITENCGTKIYLPGLSQTMAENVSLALGQQIESFDENGRAYREKSRLLSASDVRAMPNDRAICLPLNRRPILLHTRPFYRSRRLKRRSKIPAPPTRSVQLARPTYIDLRSGESSRQLPAPQSDIIQSNGKRETKSSI